MSQVRELTIEEEKKIASLYQQWEENKQDSYLKELFAVYDLDGSGFIDKAEVMAVMRATMGEYASE